MTLLVSAALLVTTAHATPADRGAASPRATPRLVALAATSDARTAVAIGPHGELYEPDGKGAWVRSRPFTTAGTIVHAGRAGSAVIAAGGGAVYRLATNGWTALRLAQKGKAVMSRGTRTVGAVGRRLYALDRTAGGVPTRLAVAPDTITAIGAGATIVVATPGGLLRVTGARVRPIPGAPAAVEALISDRWAMTSRGPIDLIAGRTTAWPERLAVTVARAGPGRSLVAVGVAAGQLELVTVDRGTITRAALPPTITGTAVDVVVDDRGRAVVALDDGRLAVRDGTTWTVTLVRTALPAPRPGPPPALSR